MLKLAATDIVVAGREPNRAEIPNIVLVIGSLQGGGAERVMTDMANYWSRKGWRITLATWSGPETADFYELDSGVRRAWLDVPGANGSIREKLCANVLRIRKLRKLLADIRPNAVLSFIDTSNVLTIIAALRLRTRVVVSERVNAAHYRGVSWQWKLLRKALYMWADVVVAQTQDMAAWIRRKYWVDACVIPNPLRRLPKVADEKEAMILAVGRLSKQKGFDLLLRAFAEICQEFQTWNLIIIGSGAERSALLTLRDELNLTRRVEIREPVKDVERWMSRAGLVVQPSRFEGFPNVLLEAMGMGAAVISADCPSGPAEIIRDGVNGCLVPVEDVASLAQAMAHLMRRPDIRSRFSNEAVKVREEYRQEKIMTHWEQCILC